jgi:hypothetical protein
MTEIGQDTVGRRFFAVLYRPDCLAELPWGNEPFDCVVFLCKQSPAHSLTESLSSDLVRSRADWVQVAGRGAEELHDAIDRASVAAGRQNAVGDGSPMTSWHDEARSPEEMAEVTSLCFGGQDRVLVLVVGQDAELRTSIKAVQQAEQIAAPNRGRKADAAAGLGRSPQGQKPGTISP